MQSNIPACIESLILPEDLGILFADYDGTLVNTMDAWVSWINTTHGASHTISDVDTWEWFNHLDKSVFDWFTSGVYQNNQVVPFDKASEFLNDIRTKIETKILTATHCSTLVKEKNTHAMYHFGEVEVIHHMDKTDFAVCQISGKRNIIIDDKPSTCEGWVEKGGIAILFNYENRYTYARTEMEHKNLFRASSFEEIPSILAQASNHIGENHAHTI